MRVIARGTLNGFVRNRLPARLQRIVKDHLDSWFALVSRARWSNSAELKAQNRSASVVSSNRVVFNIKGNEYRLIASVNYGAQIVFVLWIGTHREYDQIDVAKVRYEKKRYANSSRPK